MNGNYVFPAKIVEKGNHFILKFYDFDIYVEEDDMESLVESAQEQLALYIIDKLDRGEKIKKSTHNIKEHDIIIHIWLPYYKSCMRETYIRKNVTIPQWLDLLAKENNVNFSAALVDGIKAKLGL